jgi:DivIVA domain-containing protein
MAIAPNAVRGARFARALVGYRAKDVQAFLDAIAEDYEAALAMVQAVHSSLGDEAERALRGARAEAADALTREADALTPELSRSRLRPARELLAVTLVTVAAALGGWAASSIVA